ncbi:MAG: ribonuclease T [Pseudomonadota bacterium]
MSVTDFSDEPMQMCQRFRGYLPVVVDIETGGFNSDTDAILELGVTFLDIDETGALHLKDTLDLPVLPFTGANLDPDALKFTGIDPFDTERNAQNEADVLDELFERIHTELAHAQCKRAILVGHNASFDLKFLYAAIERNATKKNPFHAFSTLDTVSLSALAYGQTALAKCCYVAGIEFSHEHAHSAAYDAMKTAELFCNIHNKWLALENTALTS